MTDRLDQTLTDAAAQAQRVADTVHVDALLTRIEAGGSRSPRWVPALAATTVVALVVGGAVVRGQRPLPPTIDGGVLDPAATATPDPDPTPDATPGPGASCAASELGLRVEEQDLPDAVAALRRAIDERAAACDLAGVAALTSPDGFSYSFGDSTDVAEYWRGQDEAGEVSPLAAIRQVLATTPDLLAQPSGEVGGPSYWVWPRLFLMDPATADPAELDAAMDEVAATGLHTREQIEDMVTGAGAYLGYRLFIEVPAGSDGAKWTAFIAGD